MRSNDSEEWGTEMDEETLGRLMSDEDVVYEATQIFDALSDFTRFRILGALAQGEKSVGELQETCSVSQSAISHQLRLLRDRGLVAPHREGQRMIYALSDEHVTSLICVGLEHASERARAAEGEE